MQGRPQDALPEIEHVHYDPERTFLCAIAPRTVGKRSGCRIAELIAKYQAIDPYLIAKVYAFRNQPDEAFSWLDRAYVECDDGLVSLKLEPPLKGLHNVPRYVAFLKELNLPN